MMKSNPQQIKCQRIKPRKEKKQSHKASKTNEGENKNVQLEG